jgi:hypothetical protein
MADNERTPRWTPSGRGYRLKTPIGNLDVALTESGTQWKAFVFGKGLGSFYPDMETAQIAAIGAAQRGIAEAQAILAGAAGANIGQRQDALRSMPGADEGDDA